MQATFSSGAFGCRKQGGKNSIPAQGLIISQIASLFYFLQYLSCQAGGVVSFFVWSKRILAPPAWPWREGQEIKYNIQG